MPRPRTNGAPWPKSVLVPLFGILLTGCDAGSPTDPPENQAPTVTLSVSPTSGFAPLQVSLTVGCTDSDGTVVLYELDTTGDGSYDVTRSVAFTMGKTFDGTVTVRARCTDDDAAVSAVASETVQVEQRPPPTSPTGLSAVAVSPTGIDVSWTDNSADETGFRVERTRSGEGAWVQVATLGPDVAAYSDGGLTPITAYDYRVRAEGLGGFSTYSDTASATTPAAPPAAPTGLSAAAASATRIDLSWADHSTDETAFHVERSPAGSEAWTEITTLAADLTVYADIGLSGSTAYDYRVRAQGPGGFSAYSDTASATTHEEPPTTDFYVSPEGDNTHIGSEGSPWRDVQHAIDNSPAGAVLHIAAGRYAEQLTLTEAKTLVGAGADTTFIAKSGAGPIVYSTADLTLRDLSVTGMEDWSGGWDTQTVQKAIRVEGGHLSMTRAGAYNYYNFGIVVVNGSFHLLDVETGIDPSIFSYTMAADLSVHVVGSHGTIDGLVSGLAPGETQGHWVDHQIRLQPDAADTITVRNSTLYGYGLEMGTGWSDGIDIFSPHEGTPPTILIENNTILGPTGGTEAASGVELNGGNAQITLRGNTIQRFRQGFKFGTYAGATALVEGNTFQDNTSHGILVETESEIDVGGGTLGSLGGNVFRNSALYDIAAWEQSGYVLSSTFQAKHNDWGTCDLAAIQARLLGTFVVDPPAGCSGF